VRVCTATRDIRRTVYLVEVILTGLGLLSGLLTGLLASLLHVLRHCEGLVGFRGRSGRRHFKLRLWWIVIDRESGVSREKNVALKQDTTESGSSSTRHRMTHYRPIHTILASCTSLDLTGSAMGLDTLD